MDNNQDNIKDQYNECSLIKVVIFILILLIILILITSCYYRQYVKRFGIEPFLIPSFFPDIIFPRPTQDPLLRSTIEKNLDKIFLANGRDSFSFDN
jgi:hypothetical protein